MKWMLFCRQTISIMDHLHLSSVNRLSSMCFQVTALSWTALVVIILVMSCHCYACAPHEFAAHKMCYWLVTYAYLFISKSRATRSIRRYRFIKGPGLRVFTEYRTRRKSWWSREQWLERHIPRWRTPVGKTTRSISYVPAEPAA